MEDGKTGFLVEPDDTGRMTDIINGILDGYIPTSKIVEAAYKYVTSHLVWSSVIRQYEKTYMDLLSERRRRAN